MGYGLTVSCPFRPCMFEVTSPYGIAATYQGVVSRLLLSRSCYSGQTLHQGQPVVGHRRIGVVETGQDCGGLGKTEQDGANHMAVFYSEGGIAAPVRVADGDSLGGLPYFIKVSMHLTERGQVNALSFQTGNWAGTGVSGLRCYTSQTASQNRGLFPTWFDQTFSSTKVLSAVTDGVHTWV